MLHSSPSPDNASFTPADAGTPESEWALFLGKQDCWQPEITDLIVVAPHPDDETLGAGGLIRSIAMAGHRVTVVSVTDGEAADVARHDLNLIRRAELHNALRTLCPLHVPVERLGLPDGAVAQHKNRLRRLLGDLLTPAVTLLAPYERDGHPDHDCVGDICLELANIHRLPIVRFPIWAWHHSHPTHLQRLRWRRYVLSLDARRAKAHAIQCFASQTRPANGLPILPPHVVAHFERAFEAFVV